MTVQVRTVADTGVGVAQVPGGCKVGGDKPVAVAVFEWLRHLRSGQEQERCQAEEGGDRRGAPDPGQRTSTEPAQGKHLE